MKKLVIIRHAESQPENSNVDDFDRVLTSDGENDAVVLGKKLQKNNLIPDAILSSPAARTIQTAQIIAQETQYSKAIVPNQYIYQAYVTTLQEIVSFIYDENDIVFLVGHNPGVSALAYMLCDLKESIDTCATVEINFNCNSWMDVSKENVSFVEYNSQTKSL